MAATPGFPTGQVREGLNALIAENWSRTVIDLLFDRMPIMQVIYSKNGTKQDHTGLGVPDSGILLAGMSGPRMQRKSILSSFEYQPLVHHLIHGRTDVKVIGTHDNNAIVGNWEESGPERRFKRPVAKWYDLEMPCKVSNEMLDHTARTAEGERNGWAGIKSLLNVERNDKAALLMEILNELHWGVYAGGSTATTPPSTTGRPTDEDDQKWDAPHSFAEALKEDNLYMGVDRSLAANAWWRGHYITAATAPVFRDIIRDINYSETLGITLAKKNGPVDCIFVGGALFSTALSEADAKGIGGQIVSAGTKIPEYGMFGFKRDSVRIDNTWIFYDPTCPDKHLLAMKPKTWTVAIYPGKNFAQSTITDQSKNEGGDKAHTWQQRIKAMIVCEAPSENCYFTNVGGT